MRTLFIAGNWKMNPSSLEAAIDLAGAVKFGVGSSTDVHVALCPPAIYLNRIDEALVGSPIGLGGQNMSPKVDGAYTGEISGAMLVDAGCTHVILGHSERRHGMGETDEQVNAKLKAALQVGLIPIVCIGETLSERESGQAQAVVGHMLEHSLAGIEAGAMVKVVLAYEPVWAIGTGKVASPEQAQEMHAFVRGRLAAQFDEATAGRVIVQYGGSVKPENATELLGCPDIDGALVGGASLKPGDFLGIIEAGKSITAVGKA